MLNTHLDAKRTQSWLKSVEPIVGKLKETGSNTPIVFVTGDFNTRPGHELFASIKTCMADARKPISPIPETFKY